MTRRNRSTSIPAESWRYWWNFNKDRFLKLKVRLYSGRSVQSESAEFFFGRRTRHVDKDTNRPGRAYLDVHLIPRLLLALEDPEVQVRYRAAVALGRVGTAAQIPALKKLLKDKFTRVREGALIGLVLLMTEDARPIFLDILEDNKKGKNLLGGQLTNDDLRGVAALGLGLLGEDEGGLSRKALIRQIRNRQNDHHVPMVATIALGLLEGNAQEVFQIIQDLRAIADKNSRVDEWVRAQAVLAMGRITALNNLEADPAVLKYMIRVLGHNKSANLRRSAASALGYLARGKGASVPAVVKALLKELDRGKDRISRGFAAVAVGQVGGPQAHRALCERLLKEKSQLKVFCGLGLGILCAGLADGIDRGSADTTEHDRCESDQILRLKGLQYLLGAFKRTRSPELKGGLAICLGIGRDPLAGKTILKAMKASRDVRFRGDCAVALGMVGHSNAMDLLMRMLKGSDAQPRLKEHVAIGLGLMGYCNVVPPLISSLKTGKSHYSMVAITQALGFVGDRSAILPLTAFLDVKKHPTHRRAYACWALGTIGDQRMLPAFTPVRSNHNYLASCGTFNHLLYLVDM